MDEKQNVEVLQQISVSGFAYELLRGDVLFNLLGKEASSILYWEGKNIARRYPLETMDEIIQFFEFAGWGQLVVSHEKKQEIEFQLTGDLITYRYNRKSESTYLLETGFLAQQIQQQKKYITKDYKQKKNLEIKRAQ